MKKLIAKTALVSMLISSAQAGAIVDIEVGGGIWATGAPTGSMTAKGSVIDFADTTDLGSASNSYIWAVIDHAIPVIPNIRVERTTLKSTGQKDSTFNIPNVITATGTLDTELDLTHTDFIAYWGLPFGTWLPFIDELDFGLGAKVFDGSIDMAVSASGIVLDSYKESLPFAVPYGYAKLRIEPPLLFGIGFEGELKYLSLEAGSFKSNFTEYIVKADWGMMFPLPILDIKPGIEIGYRNMSLDIDAGSAGEADVGFSGIFFGLYGKFGI